MEQITAVWVAFGPVPVIHVKYRRIRTWHGRPPPNLPNLRRVRGCRTTAGGPALPAVGGSQRRDAAESDGTLAGHIYPPGVGVAGHGSDDRTLPVAAMEVVPLSRRFALDICTWRYPAPYHGYDMTEADPDELLQPELGFFAVVRGGPLIGFRSFGSDGRVPGWEYDETALDTGGGLRPELTGQGLGKEAVATGLAFGRVRFAPAAFRVTVAAFNVRALRTVSALGFKSFGSFNAATDGRTFEVLVRPEG